MKIHMLGIGGTGMGSLAGLLIEAGHEVTGTDIKLYPPMSEEIAKMGITPFEGYRAENIAAANPELVVVGNVIRKENPEAQEVMRRGIPYRSMPAALSDFFLKDRTSIVISGTHGKTTASTLAAWLLESAGEKPGFLIGGVGLNLGRSYGAGSGQFFVVEGDEYDTAFFDKGPKFLHYRPQATLITSIEFDHADIYRDLAQIMESFKKLAEIMPPDGLIVANAGDNNVMTIVKSAKCRVVTYGMNEGKWRPLDVEVSEAGTSFELTSAKGRFSLPMWGEHNLLNATGVLALLLESGIPAARLARGIESFRGVRRRQEFVSETNGVTIIDDFAHHPTAVEKTIESMRLRFPKRRLWAIFEPRSNTSKRNVFQNEFARAFSLADCAIIASPYNAESIARHERFDPSRVARQIKQSGKEACHIKDADGIANFAAKNARAGDIILVMSNGGFDGLIKKLSAALKSRQTSGNET